MKGPVGRSRQIDRPPVTPSSDNGNGSADPDDHLDVPTAFMLLPAFVGSSVRFTPPPRAIVKDPRQRVVSTRCPAAAPGDPPRYSPRARCSRQPPDRLTCPLPKKPPRSIGPPPRRQQPMGAAPVRCPVTTRLSPIDRGSHAVRTGAHRNRCPAARRSIRAAGSAGGSSERSYVPPCRPDRRRRQSTVMLFDPFAPGLTCRCPPAQVDRPPARAVIRNDRVGPLSDAEDRLERSPR